MIKRSEHLVIKRSEYLVIKRSEQFVVLLILGTEIGVLFGKLQQILSNDPDPKVLCFALVQTANPVHILYK